MRIDEYQKQLQTACEPERVALVNEREKLWSRYVAAERTYWQAVAKPYPTNRFRARTHDSVIQRLRENRDRIAKELGVE